MNPEDLNVVWVASDRAIIYGQRADGTQLPMRELSLDQARRVAMMADEHRDRMAALLHEFAK